MSIKIKNRIRKNGSASFTVEVRVRGIQQTKTFQSKKESERWAILTEEKMLRGDMNLTSGSENKKLSEVIDRFWKNPPNSAKSWLTRKSGKHFLDFWDKELGRFKIHQIRASQLIEARDKLLFRGSTPATANRYLSAISAIFQICIEEWFLVERNPVRGLRRLKENNERVRVLTERERERLFRETSRDSELHDIVLLALSTGARRGELQKLKWSDYNKDEQTLSFKDTKNGTERIIPVAVNLVELLRNRFLSRKLGSGEWIFPAPKSKGYADFSKRFKKGVSNAGIDDFKFHDLRHTAASYLAISGVTERKIAEILGHKTLQMVKRYTHFQPDHLKEEMEILTQIIEETSLKRKRNERAVQTTRKS